MSTEAHQWRHVASGGSPVATRGYHVGGALRAQALTTINMRADQLHATPILLNGTVTTDALALHAVSATSGMTAQIALYGVSCAHQPWPTQLVAQAGGVSFRGTLTDVCSLGLRVMSVALPSQGGFTIGDRRLYWLACVLTGSAQLQAVDHQTAWAIFGYDATSFTLAQTHLVASWAGTTTLPNTFPSTGWILPASNMPALALRVVTG